MSGRAAATRGRPWQQPGFQFLPRDEHGRALWPPGYEPQAHLALPTAAQTMGQEQQRQQNRQLRAAGEGWGRGTLHFGGTPANPPPPEVPPAPTLQRRGGWGVLPESHIWLTLELIGHLRRPVRLAEVAEQIHRTKNVARASLHPWLARGVLRLVPSAEPHRHGGSEPKDFAAGPKRHLVWLRAGARWA